MGFAAAPVYSCRRAARRCRAAEIQLPGANLAAARAALDPSARNLTARERSTTIRSMLLLPTFPRYSHRAGSLIQGS
jgi:hypothetical protein